jgi:hypothetical protein
VPVTAAVCPGQAAIHMGKKYGTRCQCAGVGPCSRMHSRWNVAAAGTLVQVGLCSAVGCYVACDSPVFDNVQLTRLAAAAAAAACSMRCLYGTLMRVSSCCTAWCQAAMQQRAGMRLLTGMSWLGWRGRCSGWCCSWLMSSSSSSRCGPGWLGAAGGQVSAVDGRVIVPGQRVVVCACMWGTFRVVGCMDAEKLTAC